MYNPILRTSSISMLGATASAHHRLPPQKNNSKETKNKMENRSKADVTTRASFSTSSPDSNVERSSPPSKIRRTSASVSTSSAIPKSTPQSVLDCSMNFCGFGPSEFLPIVGRKYRVPETLDPRISDTLCDDALGHCLFSGFLNSFETVRLSSISKRFRTIASYQVNRLDLSRCPDLRADDLMSIVGRFPNLKVSGLLSI